VGGLTTGLSGTAVVARTSSVSESLFRAPGIPLSPSSELKNPQLETNFPSALPVLGSTSATVKTYNKDVHRFVTFFI